MKQLVNGFVPNRILRINVGFLLGAGPGHTHDTTFDAPAVRVAEDVDLLYLRGPLRLSRTKEGVLVQGKLHVGIESECYRCLKAVARDVVLEIEELYNYEHPEASEFSIAEDGMLHLAPLLREEALIADSHGVICREDCKGLCGECGVNLNNEPDHHHEAAIDSRMIALQRLLK